MSAEALFALRWQEYGESTFCWGRSPHWDQPIFCWADGQKWWNWERLPPEVETVAIDPRVVMTRPKKTTKPKKRQIKREDKWVVCFPPVMDRRKEVIDANARYAHYRDLQHARLPLRERRRRDVERGRSIYKGQPEHVATRRASKGIRPVPWMGTDDNLSADQ